MYSGSSAGAILASPSEITLMLSVVFHFSSSIPSVHKIILLLSTSFFIKLKKFSCEAAAVFLFVSLTYLSNNSGSVPPITPS